MLGSCVKASQDYLEDDMGHKNQKAPARKKHGIFREEVCILVSSAY